MILENFRSRDDKKPGILDTVAQVEASSSDAIESARLGFAFPVHEKIRNMGNKTIRAFEGRELSRTELMKTMLTSIDRAWKEAIQPQIGEMRRKGVAEDSLKGGIDFFNKADVDSEELIRACFVEKFGEENLRIFGEESAQYLGNINSHAGLRIDPIDGSESIRFGKPNWGIMEGVYEGMPDNERQVQGAVYLPERHALICYEEDAGVFITDTQSGEVREIKPFAEQNELGDIIVNVWRHTDKKQRGKIAAVEAALFKKGARIRSAGNCDDVLDAMLMSGARAMVIDGDYNEVDYICNSWLERLGYSLYTWSGELVRADDASLSNRQIIIVPPGKAGEEILNIVKQFAR